MRSSDWSSDVCSSDLLGGAKQTCNDTLLAAPRRSADPCSSICTASTALPRRTRPSCCVVKWRRAASHMFIADRQSVVLGMGVSVRVVLGGSGHIQNTKIRVILLNRITKLTNHE